MVTSIILLVQPVVTVGLSMVLLGERPSIAQLAGVALVIGGIAVATVPLARLRDASCRDATSPRWSRVSRQRSPASPVDRADVAGSILALGTASASSCPPRVDLSLGRVTALTRNGSYGLVIVASASR